MIIIDDGSTDNSREIVKSYHDNRIVLIENSHDFIRSLNTGINISKGKYIARMDSDDIMLPYRLEIQFKYMEDNPETDICGSWMETFGMEPRIIKSPVRHDDIALYLLKGNSLSHPTIIMRSKSYPNLYKSNYTSPKDLALDIKKYCLNENLYNAFFEWKKQPLKSELKNLIEDQKKHPFVCSTG